MNKKISLGAAIAFMLIMASVAVSITVMVSQRSFTTKTNNLQQRESMYTKLSYVENAVSKSYLGEVDTETLMDTLARGYVDGIGDPYATYYTAKEYSAMMQSFEGKIAGIGISVEQDPSGYIRVLDVYPESPAQSAGILKGNLIVKVDEVEVTKESYAATLDAIKGKAGTKLNLVVRDEESNEDRDVELTRRIVVAPTVFSNTYDQVGYIKITEINDNTFEQFKKAVTKLTDEGVKGLVLDLRNNTGGTLKSTTKILDMLLPEGDILSATYKNGETKVLAVSDADAIQLPMAVLVNEKTASFAELMAQALRDYNVAKIVGTKTFGKGSMQEMIKMEDGSAINLTVAKFNPPKSANFEGVGIKPDYEVTLTDEQKQMLGQLDETTDPQMKKALEYVNTEISKNANLALLEQQAQDSAAVTDSATVDTNQ